MAFFFFLPSMLLSGFMFPFRGMPQWAQNLGEVLPELWPMLAFLLVAGAVALLRYRQTLD